MFLPLPLQDEETGKMTMQPHVHLHPYLAEGENIRWAGGIPSVGAFSLC